MMDLQDALRQGDYDTRSNYVQSAFDTLKTAHNLFDSNDEWYKAASSLVENFLGKSP